MVNVYTPLGKRDQQYNARTLNQWAASRGASVVKGTIKSLEISGRKWMGNTGTSLDGEVFMACRNTTVSLKISALPVAEAPKHYEDFLKEMGCNGVLDTLLGYTPAEVVGKEIGVIINGGGTPIGYISTSGLKEIGDALRNF